MKKVFGICGLIAVTVLPIDGREPLTITVTPLHSFAPSKMTVHARIEPSAANRSLTIVADGENYYRSSEISLEGSDAPKTIQMPLVNVPGGEYEISAVLLDASGNERAVAHQSATVLSVGGD